jgi:tetratricopeptide (TPR) repeat protein
MGLAIILIGCSSSIRFQVKRAPEINLPGVKTLKLGTTGISGKMALEIVRSDKTGTVGKVVDKGLNEGVEKLARKKYPSILQEHAKDFMEVFLKNGYYEIAKGRNYDAIVNAEMEYTVADRGGEIEVKDKQGNVSQKYEIVRTASVVMKFNITDKSGKFLGSSQVSGRSSSKARGKNRLDANIDLKGWEPLLRAAVRGTHVPLHRKIAPYLGWESRKLAKGKSRVVKKANKEAKKGNWPYAVELWTKGLSTGKNKDKQASLFNLGIYEESKGNLEEALNKYEAAYSISKDVKQLHTISRIKARIQEEARVEATDASRE